MKVSIDAAKLHHVSEADALNAFEDFIGPPEAWGSEMLRYRIQSEWQKDWRVEVGQWVLRARELGFEDWIQRRLTGTRKLIISKSEINDQAHVNLSSELAPAMLAHYLLGTGWKFGAWEPTPTEPDVDIDETLISPTGHQVAFQVKAPDRPGKWFEQELVQPGDGKIIKRQVLVMGEIDEWVRSAVRKAAGQLSRTPTHPQMIALCSQRQKALGSSPRVIESLCLGSSINIDGDVRLDHGYIDQELAENSASPLKRGEFRDNWNHIGAVMMLDYRRGLEDFDYMCTVIMNPWAQPAARCEREWFQYGRVLDLVGEEFRWAPSVPDETSYRSPTRFVASP